MMFSSNQVLAISGELNIEYIKAYLDFALNIAHSGKNPNSIITYQISEDNKYCIGWGVKSHSKPDGWKEYDFDFDSDIVARIILQHLQKVDPFKVDNADRASGFIMKVIPETLSDKYLGIIKPFYGLVSFEPFLCEYSK